MQDRELLEKAATAAGLGLPGKDDADPIGRQYSPGLGLWVRWAWGEFGWFNPVGDGRHALWLAVELGLQVTAYPMYDEPKHSVIVRKPVWNHDAQEGDGVEVVKLHSGDPHGATWRAITLAAAELADRETPNVRSEPEPEFECLGEPSLCENPRGCACVPDRTPTPGCHTPEGCRENGCLGWCDEHRPEAVPDSKTPNARLTGPKRPPQE